MPHPPYCVGKLTSMETVQKKGKGKSAVVENKTVLKIHVPGVAVARYLAERERSSGPEAVTFSLLQKQGPPLLPGAVHGARVQSHAPVAGARLQSCQQCPES